MELLRGCCDFGLPVGEDGGAVDDQEDHRMCTRANLVVGR